MSHYRVSMDIGGTCTDAVAYDSQTGTYTAGTSSATPGHVTPQTARAVDGTEVQG